MTNPKDFSRHDALKLAAPVEIQCPHIVAFEYEKRDGDKLVGLAESVGCARGLLAGMAT